MVIIFDQVPAYYLSRRLPVMVATASTERMAVGCGRELSSSVHHHKVTKAEGQTHVKWRVERLEHKQQASKHKLRKVVWYLLRSAEDTRDCMTAKATS